jgi:hypothetical protein
MKMPATAVVAALALSATAAQAQFYRLGPSDTPSSVTNAGVVAGYDDANYFVWSLAGGRTVIPGAIPGNGTGGIPRITADGLKLGATNTNPATGMTEIASYDLTSRTWTTYGGLGASSDNSVSGGFGMNASGTVQVGNAWVDAANAHAIVVRNGVLSELGSSVAGRSSRADAVSNDGSLIGGYQDREDGWRAAAVWIDGVQQVLTTQGGDPLGWVNDVSGDGMWAVGGGGYYAGGSAYMWNRNTGVKYLDNPFAADGWEMYATSVSFDGSVVIGYAQDLFFQRLGWIWTEASGTMAMEDYAARFDGYDGEHLLGPLAISQDGRNIVGYGLSSSWMEYTGWMISVPVPEPSTWATMALGLGLLGFVGRRRSSRPASTKA